MPNRGPRGAQHEMFMGSADAGKADARDGAAHDQHGMHRLTALTDGVFAIALTLAALEIHFPDQADSVGEMLNAAQGRLLGYFISFYVIASFWVSHRDLFARLRHLDRPLTALILGHLCLVALIPAAVHLTAINPLQVTSLHGRPAVSYSFGTAAMRTYALAMVLAGGVDLTAWAYAAIRPGIMSDIVDRSQRIDRLRRAVMIPMAFGALLWDPRRGVIGAIVIVAALSASRWAFRRGDRAGRRPGRGGAPSMPALELPTSSALAGGTG